MSNQIITELFYNKCYDPELTNFQKLVKGYEQETVKTPNGNIKANIFSVVSINDTNVPRNVGNAGIMNNFASKNAIFIGTMTSTSGTSSYRVKQNYKQVKACQDMGLYLEN